MQGYIERKIVNLSKDLKALLKQSEVVQGNPVKRLHWQTEIQDIIDYLEDGADE